MSRWNRAIPAFGVAAVVAASCLGCGGPRRERATSGAVTAPVPQVPSTAQQQGLPHGDHNPHHGGVVMMKGELHYEVVLDPTGRTHQLYFSDAIREDLPASFASTASFTVKRPGEADEIVPLEIDSTGESWIGSGRSVANPAATMVRVAFTVENEPYWIDVPFNGAKD